MKTINIISYSLFLLLGSASCSSILDENPQGIISDEDLNTVDKVEQMITAAYSFCGQNHFNKQFGMPYEEGSLRGGEAYKGAAGTSDNAERHTLGNLCVYATYHVG